jgi:hypothetical protein
VRIGFEDLLREAGGADFAFSPSTFENSP